jgi:integrase/recombinase XerC
MTGVSDFLAYLKSEKRYSEHTLGSYRNDLEQFHVFCHESGFESMDLHFKTIRSWVVVMMEQNYAPKSIHRKLSSLRSYCKYLVALGELETNPVEKVLKPKLKKRVPAFIDEKSINLLLDEYDFGADFSGARNRLIINILYQTGIRRSELIGLRLRSVHLAERTIKVRGKRDKERLIPIGNELAEDLGRYIEMRNSQFPRADTDSLLLTDRGQPLYAQFIYRTVHRFLAMITTHEQKSPHILRHTFATHMLNKGAELNAIKELLGHANLSATQVYTHNTFEKLRSIYNQAHPRA